MTELYTPADIDEANEVWKANCGPVAFAALLGRPVASVRRYFPRYPGKPWTNPTQMVAALTMAWVSFEKASTHRLELKYGLAFLQLDGPWCKEGTPVTVAYKHTHWIGVSRDAGRAFVFDVNAGQWRSASDWSANVIPMVVDATEGASGWFVRTAFEVDPDTIPDPGIRDAFLADVFARAGAKAVYGIDERGHGGQFVLRGKKTDGWNVPVDELTQVCIAGEKWERIPI